MAFLPTHAHTFQGGCFCGAARYTICIPSAESRPQIPHAAPTPTSATTSTTTTLPICTLDHCSTCRYVAGSIITCWLIIPPKWITWEISSLKDIPTVDITGPSPHPSSPLTQYRATDRAIRTFCSTCGTHLTYYNLARHGTDSAFVDVTVGSLDERSLKLVRPERHGWWDSGVEWIRELMRWGTGEWMVRHRTGDVKVVVSNERAKLWDDGERCGNTTPEYA